MNITILGKEFPIEYTIQAQQEMAEKFGDSFFDEVSTDSFVSAAKSMMDISCIISILMNGAEKRERVRCMMYDEEFKGPKALTAEEVAAAVHPRDFVGYRGAIIECIKSAQKVTVEIQKEKNVKATL